MMKSVMTARKRKYNKKIRTVAYCRVSTFEEQFQSLRDQINYYKKLIDEKSTLRFIRIYFDYRKSGLRSKGRHDFNQMIKDAKQRKFNLIITKSVSRFSRNTVDLLSTIRMLKRYDVQVYFEVEDIYTENQKSEVLLSILGALAQETSRNKSGDIKWGIQRRMEKGEYNIKPVYGYIKKNNELVIDENQAEVIREIFDLHLDGKTCQQIAEYLNNKNIKSPTNGKQWNARFIERVLNQEKYVDKVIFQKTFVEDYLTSKRKVNNGEQAKYVIHNNHAPIISKDTYNKVKKEFERRSRFEIDEDGNKTFKKNQYSKYEWTNILRCGYCGRTYRRRTERGKIVYRCATRIEKGRDACNNSITLNEEIIEEKTFENNSSSKIIVYKMS